MKNLKYEVKFDTTKLDAIEKELGKSFYTKLGILGDKNNRDSTETNSFIGSVQEYGSKTMGIPSRSFLRVPIYDNLPKKLNKIGKVLMDSLTKENIKDAYDKLGKIGEAIVQQAFATRGFGKWKANSDFTVKGGWMRNKKSGKPFFAKGKKSDVPLIDTGELRRSITSKVVSK